MSEDNQYFLLSVAKESVRAYLVDPQVEFSLSEPVPSNYRKVKKAVFVTIYDDQNQLRGRMGTYEATQDNIVMEIMANAIAAATRDHRFKPISLSEINNCRFCVDILTDMIKIDSLDEIDPAIEGMLLIKDQQKAIVLPGTEGVNSVADQINHLLEQTGLNNYYGADIYKFEVEHIE